MSHFGGGIGRAAALVLFASVNLFPQAPQTPGERAIEWGFEQRVRNENWDNIMDFNDGMADLRNQIRWRTRVWANLPATSNIDFFVGLNQETNQIIRTHTPWRMDEGVVENAYIAFKRLFVKGLSLRVGRQNLIKGDPKLMDGFNVAVTWSGPSGDKRVVLEAGGTPPALFRSVSSALKDLETKSVSR
jgi:hypothetical protein